MAGSHIPFPKTANELWFDALVRHQVYLMRLSGGVRNDINGLLNATEKSMVDRIHAVLQGNTKLSPARLRKAESLIKQLKQIRTEAWIEVDGVWRETMKDLTTTEVSQVNQMLHTVSPAKLSTQLPSIQKLQALVKTHPFEGRVLGSWSKKIAVDDISRIAGEIRMGVVQGDTTQEIARRVIGSAKLKGADGATQITRRNAEAITRTAVNSFSNAARSEYFKENEDLFNKEVFVATLDGVTTAICRALDGDRFPVGEGAKPPLHFSCRSLRVAEINGEVIGMRPAKPVTEKMVMRKYARENKLGKITKRSQLPRGHKGKYDAFQRTEMRKMVGRVPAKVTYNEWLKGQSVEFQNDVLGPTRGKLFRQGGLSLDKFVDKKGAIIRLDQLADTDAAAFKAAGLSVEKTATKAVRSLKIPTNYQLEGMHGDYSESIATEFERLEKQFPMTKGKFGGVKFLSEKDYLADIGDSGSIAVAAKLKAGGPDHIFLNGKFLGKNSIYDANAMMKKLVKEGAGVGNNVQSIATHEFGHVVNSSLPKSIQSKLKDYYWKLDMNGMRQLRSQLSEYAMEDPFEMFAEAFTQWQQTGATSSVASEIMNMAGLMK